VSAEANNGVPRVGYYPLRVLIDNASGPREKMTLTFTGTMEGAGHVTKTLELAAGDRRTVSLMIPAGIHYGRLQARAPGVTEKREAIIYSSAAAPEQAMVLSLGTTEEFEKAVGTPPSSVARTAIRVLAMPVGDAPSELAGYVGFDVVTLPHAGFDSLSEGARRALEAYAATGGTVLAPNAGRSMGQHFALAPVVDGHPTDYGLGRVLLSAASSRIDLASLADPEKHHELAVKPMGSDRPIRTRFARYAAEEDTGSESPLLPQATAPVATFLVIISLFTLLIGPGSIWVARKRGPAALLVTIPGTALVTCVLIVGSSLAKDGFSIHASSHGYTELDSRHHRAISAGVTAYYANLSPSSAHFDTLSAALGADPETGERYEIGMDWGESVTAGSEFLPSRTYREWGFLSVTPTRARVIVKASPEGITVQNALGAKVRSLTVSTGKGLFEVHDLFDGSEAIAKMVDTFTAPSPPASADRRLSAETLRRRSRPLADGQFIAEVEGLGFLPDAGLHLNHHDSLQIVRGEFE